MTEDNYLEKYLRDTNFPEIEDVENLPDRATGIVLASIIDDRLGVTIKSHLRPESTLAEELFGERGRLADFGTKIDIGYLLGIYDRRERKALHAVREIRNKFAHRPEPVKFEDDLVAPYMRDLEFARGFHIGPQRATRRDIFKHAAIYLLGVLITAHQKKESSKDQPPSSSPDKRV